MILNEDIGKDHKYVFYEKGNINFDVKKINLPIVVLQLVKYHCFHWVLKIIKPI